MEIAQYIAMLFKSLPTVVFRKLQNSQGGMSLKPGSVKVAIQVAQRVGKNYVIDVNIQNKNEKSNRNGTGTPGPNCFTTFCHREFA